MLETLLINYEEAAAIILFIGILVFTMLERMISFFSSVFEELMRRI